MEIIIPSVPISVNLLYRTCRGRPRLSKRGRQYKIETRQYVESQFIGMHPLESKISLTVDMYFKDKRKRDVDNHLKSLLDSLEGIMFVDDSQIYEIIARKTIGCPENRTVISLAEL
jgi:crossover junction endodeoxyribonuclease RusA